MLTKYPTLPIHHHLLLLLQCRCSSDFNPLLFSLIIIIIFKIISLYGPANTKPAILLTLYRCRCFISSLFFFFCYCWQNNKKKLYIQISTEVMPFQWAAATVAKVIFHKSSQKRKRELQGVIMTERNSNEREAKWASACFLSAVECVCLCLSHLLWINDEISSFREVIVR